VTADAAEAWTPEFDGQRRPFGAGNEQALVHGAWSGRHLGPLAARIAQELLNDPDVPEHIREPLFAASVQAWARSEAVCRLLADWLADRDLMAGLTAEEVTTEAEKRTESTTRRKSVTRSVPAVLDMLRKYESIAMNLRAKLGLDPASAARVGRDLAVARRMNVDATPLDEALAAIEERRALTAGSAGE
jgi:hypothetical protein